MFSRPTAPIGGAICAAFLASALPAGAGVLSGSAIDTATPAATYSVQLTAYGAPAGARCLKWTRRWNPRHGIGVRRCVRWR